MKTGFLLVLFFLPRFLFAQELAGVWTGYIKTPGSELAYELAISEDDKRVTGYSLIIYPKDGIENIGIKTAKLKIGKSNILVEDEELVYNNFTTQSKRVKLYCDLRLIKKDTSYFLIGSFKTRSIDFTDTRKYEGEVYLQRSGNPLSTKLMITLDEININHNLSFVKTFNKVQKPVSKNPPGKKEIVIPPVTDKKNISSIDQRKIEKIREIEFSGDTLLVNIYDNGVVDGDTISITSNNNLIATNVGLTTKAYQLHLPSDIKTGDSILLIMHAQNLGLIPPNTGLIIIKDGPIQHEIRFSADFQKSAAILLRRKK